MSGALPSAAVTLFPITRGKSLPGLGEYSNGAVRFSTDPVGIFTLQFRGIVEGSRVRVETVAEGSTLDEFVSTASEIENRTLSLYASGNPRNNLRIKVRNASGTPAYVPFESQAVAQLGTVIVYVFQEPDE